MKVQSSTDYEPCSSNPSERSDNIKKSTRALGTHQNASNDKLNEKKNLAETEKNQQKIAAPYVFGSNVDSTANEASIKTVREVSVHFSYFSNKAEE